MKNENVFEGTIKDFNDFDVYAYMSGDRKKPTVTLEEYEKRMKDKSVFKTSFPCVDEKGNLYVYESDIKIQMDNRDIDGFGYNAKYRSDKLTESYAVVVVSVDKKAKLVKVSSNQAKEEPRKKLEEALRKGIEAKEFLRVPAIIVSIVGNGSIALINIAGLGLAGSIRLAEWSPAYTKTFYNAVQTGSEVEVVVTGYGKWESGQIFDCSRKKTINIDPWKDIEKKLPVRTVVRLKCISKEARNFFGVIESVPELNVFCEYPDEESGIMIATGIEYTGYVAKVSEENKLLRVRIIKQVE